MSARNYVPILKSELAVHAGTEKSLGPFRDVVTLRVLCRTQGLEDR